MIFLYALLQFSHANSVLFGDIEANNGTAKRANEIKTQLVRALKKDKKLDIRTVEELEPTRDQEAAAYMKECLAGEYAGCTFTLAERAELQYALSMSMKSAAVVALSVIDVSQGKILLTQELPADDPLALSRKTKEVLGKAVRGELKPKVVPKKEKSEEEKKKEEVVEKKVVRDDGVVYALEPVKIIKKAEEEVLYSKEQIEEMKREEGTKEWDKLSMGPDEFMEFMNSDIPLLRWRELKRGRQGMLLVRLGGGIGFLPSHAFYYGRSVFSNVDGSLVESYAWQIPESGTSVLSELSINYGITPKIDLGLTLGNAGGRFFVDLWTQTAGQTPTFRRTSLANNVLFIEPEISYVSRTTSLVKPVAAVSVSIMQNNSAVDYIANFEETYPVLDSSTLVLLKLKAGVELSLSPNVDVWIRTPISYVLAATNGPAVEQEGGGALPAKERDIPGGYTPAGFGVVIGVQSRIDMIKLTDRIFKN